jgi:hypothetical protein
MALQRCFRPPQTCERRLRKDGVQQCGDELAQQAPSARSGQAA